MKTKTMISKTSAIEILKRLKPSLEKQYSVHSLALFGSYARGDQTAASDIDIQSMSNRRWA